MDPEDAIEKMGPGTSFHITTGCICGLANASDAVTLLAVSFILVAYPDTLSGAAKGALSASVFSGMLIGGAVSGLLAYVRVAVPTIDLA